MKYYYNCPLKAAYMARYHGLSFGLDFGGDVQWSPIRAAELNDFGPLYEWEAILDQYNIHSKFYIHQDSLHLLEPLEYDLIQWPTNAAQEYDQTVCGYTFKHGGGKIIQRNGKAFMWPEVEP